MLTEHKQSMKKYQTDKTPATLMTFLFTTLTSVIILHWHSGIYMERENQYCRPRRHTDLNLLIASNFDLLIESGQQP